MKLPLITTLPCGTTFHVLQFEEGMAYGVDEKTLKVLHVNIDVLTALSEVEYAEYKKRLSLENIPVISTAQHEAT